jgi:predicted nuclease of predicted toxin-antitoxin system
MSARFKLDENIPRDALELLRGQGHDVETVVSEGLGGRADDAILRAAHEEQRVLVTLDMDFADIRAYPNSEHSGIWVLKPVNQSASRTLGLLRSAVRLLATESATGSLWIVEPHRVRIRR